MAVIYVGIVRGTAWYPPATRGSVGGGGVSWVVEVPRSQGGGGHNQHHSADTKGGADGEEEEPRDGRGMI